MQFALLVLESPADFAERSDPATVAAYMGAYMAYNKVLEDAGVFAGGATTVRDTRRHVQDGPFADTKEQVGGFYLIEVPDLDAALHYAALCPAATRAGVEMRPTLPAPPRA